ncbi:MAG: hypothetical protein WA405_07700 [Candidatus Acidiferrales bacterium]
MTRRRIFAAWAALAAGLAIMAAPLPAKEPQQNTLAKPGAKVWLKAEVIHADAHSIVVREEIDMRMIHTFTYAPAVQAQMLKIINQGGYQYGDKVKILHQQGQIVALAIIGKPSKPH